MKLPLAASLVPSDLMPYVSGHTLATIWDMAADWPVTIKKPSRTTLLPSQFENFLAGVAE